MSYTNDRKADAEDLRTGPLGFIESRIRICPLDGATSTQATLPALRLALRHWRSRALKLIFDIGLLQLTYYGIGNILADSPPTCQREDYNRFLVSNCFLEHEETLQSNQLSLLIPRR